LVQHPTSAQRDSVCHARPVTAVRTSPFWRIASSSTNELGDARRCVGRARFGIGRPSTWWYSTPCRRVKASMSHPDQRDNYLDTHRRNTVLPMSQKGQDL